MNIRTIVSGVVALLAAAVLPVMAADTVRPEIGKVLQAAQELIKAGKYKEVIAKTREADAIADRTPYERYLIDRMRGSAAAAVGDEVTASRAFEAVLDTGRLQPAERLLTLEALASSAYRSNDYAKALQWSQRYFKEGGSSGQMRNLQVSAQYLSGDFAGVVRSMQERVSAAEQTVPSIDEPTLRLLAASQLKLGDEAGYIDTLEKLVARYPKREYWADLLARVQNRPGFPDRLALDMYRLRFATQTLDETTDYVEMAQLAVQAGLPAEAVRVVEAGYKSGKLGSGPEAERHKRLRDLAVRQVSEDTRMLSADIIGRSSEALVNTGFALASLGNYDRGIELMEQGITRGGLKHADEARLHLAQSYLASGRKAKAIDAFRGVRGPGGAGDLARLWLIVAQSSS